MNRIEDEFKNKFSKQELSNDRFDSDGLWNDIASDLDEDVKPSFRWQKGLGLIFALALGLGAFGIYYNYSSIKEISQKQNSIENNISKSVQKGVDSPTTSSQIEQENKSQTKSKNASEIGSEIISDRAITNIKNSENYNENSVSEVLGKSKATKPADTDLKQTKKTADYTISENRSATNIRNKSATKDEGSNTLSKAISDTNRSDKSDIDKKDAPSTKNVADEEVYSASKSEIKKNKTEKVASTENKHNLDQNASSSTENNDTDTSPSTPSNKAIQGLENTTISTQSVINQPFTLPSQVYFVEYDHYFDIDEQIIPYSTPENDESNNSPWEINIWGGMNSTNLNYNSDLLPDLALVKNNAEKNQLGASFGLGLSKVLNNKYTISSGLEYHQSWSKFDYTKIDSSDVLKENQLVKIWVNSTTGDTINRINDDVYVNSVTTLKIIHHNKYQRFTIPVQFGLQKSTHNIVYGLSVGATFNFTISQSGKTLDSNASVVEFDKDSPASNFNPFGIGLRINPFIGYRISEKMTLNIQPQWNWAARSNFDGSDIKVTAQQLNLNLGFGYRFE